MSDLVQEPSIFIIEDRFLDETFWNTHPSEEFFETREGAEEAVKRMNTHDPMLEYRVVEYRRGRVFPARLKENT